MLAAPTLWLQQNTAFLYLTLSVVSPLWITAQAWALIPQEVSQSPKLIESAQIQIKLAILDIERLTSLTRIALVTYRLGGGRSVC